MQRHRHAVPLALADERAGDQVDLGRPVRLDVLEHRRVVARRRAASRGTFISHGSSSQLDPGGRRDRLALVHQVAHEVAEVGRARSSCGEPRLVREAR